MKGFWRIGEGFRIRFTLQPDGTLVTEWLPALPEDVSPGLKRRYWLARRNYLAHHSAGRSLHRLAV